MDVSAFISSPATNSTVNRLVASYNKKKGRILYKAVMERGIRVHRSVRTRVMAQPMEGTKKKYRPKIRFMIDGKPQRLTSKEWEATDPKHFTWVD